MRESDDAAQLAVSIRSSRVYLQGKQAVTALAEALLAAQRQAIGALSKQYLSFREDDASDASAALSEALDAIGCTDTVEQGYLLTALEYLRQLGAQAPASAAKPSPENEPASQKQLDYLAKLADEKHTMPPDRPLTKARASEAITALQNGTYNVDEWTAPF